MSKWFTYQKAPIPSWACLLWLAYPFWAVSIDETLKLTWLTVIVCLAAGFFVLHGILALHELGHVLAGRVVGLKVTGFLVGSGRRLLKFKFGSVEVTWKLLPEYGQVHTLQSRHLLSLYRFGFFLAGGILAETLLAWTLWYVYQNPVSHGLVWEKPIARYLLITAGFFLFSTIISSAWPETHQVEGAPLPSDGLQLWSLWKMRRTLPAKQRLMENLENYAAATKRRDIASADEHFRTLLREGMREPDTLVGISRFLEQHGNIEGARESLEQALLKIPQDSPLRGQVLDLLACLVLNHGRKDWLRDADRWSALALAEAPNSVTLKGTRGSILAELGCKADARSLLLQVLDSTKADHDRAYCFAYLAWLDALDGEHPLAAEKMRKAESFNLPITAVSRLGKIIAVLRDSPTGQS